MKRIFWIFILTVLTFGVKGQGFYKHSVAFYPDIYFGVNAGLNTYVGEGAGTYYRTQPLTNTLGFSESAVFGYNFSPVFGMRIMPGYMTHQWPDNRINYAVEHFSSEGLTVDLMMNLMNINRYIKYRPVNVNFFVGAGGAYCNPFSIYGGVLSYIARGGLQGEFCVTPAFHINIDAELNAVADNYNGYPLNGTFGTPFDLIPAVRVGFTYHIFTLGPNRFRRSYMWNR